ncbi:MAG: Polysaccharide export transporter [Candidatus Daviesbacteria bacterium GW2011_GWF2_38_7]|nr:MAG: Polysaccharide export transporter [Candidatus Daviesbacteria bacterium GW2011_GWF2_38_7]
MICLIIFHLLFLKMYPKNSSFRKIRLLKKHSPVSCLENHGQRNIKCGETVGIVGNNGAGKSTILKLIAGVTVPTEGAIKVNGNVAPLIELGAGFHQELSGLENIYLNAAILGMHKKEIDLVIDKIIDFSGLAVHPECIPDWDLQSQFA